MAEFYDIPTQTLGSAGLLIDLGNGGVSSPNGVYITIVETAGVAWTLTIRDLNNTYAAPLTIAASQPYQAKKIPNVRFITATGSGAQLTGKVTDYEISPDSIVVSGPVAITGTVNTHTLVDDSWSKFVGSKVPVASTNAVLTSQTPPP